MAKKVILLLLLAITQILAAEPCGDVNSNGTLDIVDALLVAQHSVGLSTTGFDEAAADVSGDGVINIVDALLLAQYYVGLITVIPGCPVVTPTPSVDYQAATDRIEGESYEDMMGIETESCDEGGQNIGYIENNDYALYYVDFSAQVSQIQVRAASNISGGTIEVRLDSLSGRLIGTVAVPGTGGWQTWQTVSGVISDVTGLQTVYLVFKGGSDYLYNINWFTFAAGTPAPTPEPTPGQGWISINDQPSGWVSMNGGVTGGGSNLGSAVTVTTMGELRSEASGTDSKIILLRPGTYVGTLEPGANKTIIGTAPGVTIQGNLKISGSSKSNIIIRNLAVRGNPCYDYETCKAGADAVYIGQDAHHIWLDHLDIADGQDGNCDITRAGDYVTVSWTQFHYTYNKEHRFSNLIAGSDTETESRGKLQISYFNCWWGERVNSRMPRGRFGKVHILNCYFNSQDSSQTIHGVGYEMSLIAENCYYDVPSNISIFKDMSNPTGWKGLGNRGSAQGMNDSRGSVFTIPYSYTSLSASEVKAAITSTVGGAGNTCQLLM